MPSAKPKPSEVAAEAKKTYIPYIEQKLSEFPVKSYLHGDSAAIRIALGVGKERRLRVAVIDGDPVEVALGWYESNVKNPPKDPEDGSPQLVSRIPIVNMANEKRAGGDWESGLLAPEECLCRRSNLVHALITPWTPNPTYSNYPIPQKGGIYSPFVGMFGDCASAEIGLRELLWLTRTVIFRSGPERYEVWRDFKALPVISVAPVRRPKLDDSGTHYSFDQEKELMKEKMRVVLRIAAAWQHKDICLGAFGVGYAFRNPVAEVATMWKDILFSEEEFENVFSNIVFAIESSQTGNAKGGLTDFDVFKQEFDPSNISQTHYR
ncbi:MAG: hypothetical protein M1827_001676 [Pycnora praestabilis]|nr:MAG: hypothetical protein M1827_001676 [Pycnora praestabilis]